MNVEFILSVVIASATVCYTIINLMMWFESRATRKQKITPFIVAYLQSTENHMNEVLHIKNIGEGYAKDVRFKILKDYKRLGVDSLLLSECGAIKKGVSSFPPQYEVTYYIENWCDLGDRNICDYIELEISYKRMDGRRMKNIYMLPLNEIIDQNYSSPPDTYLGQIPHYLKELNCTLKTVSEK